MPTLIIEQSGKRTGGMIVGRVLIGRLPTNGVVVSESSVSRLHAWIDRDAHGNYFIGDGGSLTGTVVNGRPIEKSKPLDDADVVRIGTARLIFSMDDDLPSDVAPINLAGLAPGKNIAEAGVLFDCPCGTPIWFKAATIGQAHICRHCGRTITIPSASGTVAQAMHGPKFIEPGIPPVEHEGGEPEMAMAGVAPALEGESDAVAHEPLFQHWHSTAVSAEPQDVGQADIVPIEELVASPSVEMCSICHTGLGNGESTTDCPKCRLTFHAACWQENLGCSAYGCSQVGVLKTPELESESAETPVTEEAPAPGEAGIDEDLEAAGFPWEFAFVAVSVAGALLGALSYGVPALIGAIGTAIYLAALQDSPRRRSVAFIALLVCVLGTAGGAYLSFLWWHGWPPIAPFLPRGGGR